MAEHPFIAALALMLVFEGLMPLLAPQAWKQLLLQMAQMDDNHLRLFGAFMLVTGAVIFNYIQS